MEEHRLKKERELHGTRESPEISKVIGVFGLSLRTGKEDLESMFTKFGPLEKSVIVYDHRSGRSRGFGFVYFEDQHHATDAREAMNGAEIDNRKIRVDYSTTHRPHTPTPGAYMGEKLRNDTRRYQRRYSPARSPVRRRSYGRRSRSRSWSR
ncbi:hypothetical protein BDF14DRAFT_1006661 [Spinellus fusiger]|nr:hypothetical protein BDF14DRAFT_1006661 [Spinellus fusiger]